MPKVSKVQPPKPRTSRPGEPTPPKEKLEKFICTRCSAIYKRQRGNFAASQSPIYKGNGGYMSVCSNCLDDLFHHYKTVLGDEAEAMKRMCMKFDIYWNPDIYAMVSKANTSASRIRSYISKTNLVKYVGKSFDDTLDEEGVGPIRVTLSNESDSEHTVEEVNIPDPTVEQIEFWGAGFSPDFYFDLQSRYNRWTHELPMPMDRATEAFYRQVCTLEATINRNAAAGKPIEQSVNSLNALLGSMNLKPVQKKQDEALDSAFEDMPFGVGIRMCENTRPIPKPNPEFEDVDGVVRYISIWFLGHLCKMLGIRNTYCKLYEDEMARLKVERLETTDEDDEGAFNDIFGDSGGDTE